MKTAKEQAKTILWALMEATRIGEPMSVEITIIENGLKEYASQNTLDRDKVKEIVNKAVREYSGLMKRSYQALLDEHTDAICSLAIPSVSESICCDKCGYYYDSLLESCPTCRLDNLNDMMLKELTKKDE